MDKIIYVDNAATTAVSNKVLEAMIPYYKEKYGNPSSIYSLGRGAKKAIEQARETVAKCINANPNEIFFTSGGSEADNWAIKSIAFEQAKKGKKHIITSSIEHHAVLHCVESLEKQGFKVTCIKVNEKGMVNPKDIEEAINENTALVSIMYANNEIGTIQPIKEIGEICRKRGVPFHTDAVQAIGNLHVDVVNQNIDMMSISAHKFHGPKGVGALYVKKGMRIKNFIDGGAQERGLRAGTENVAGIVGLSVAMKEACDNIDKKSAKLKKMRDRLIESITKIKRTRINGDLENRLPGNVNISFEGIEGEGLLLLLDMKGICASSGSACTSGSLDPSHVLLAIGLPHEIAHGSLRISLGENNTDEEIDYIIECIPPIIERLRSMSPLWEKIVEKEKEERK